jgi:hypothetical protein
MSAQEFDQLTKAFASGNSRRGVLTILGRTFAAGATATVVSALGSGTAAAARRPCDPLWHIACGNACCSRMTQFCCSGPAGSMCCSKGNECRAEVELTRCEI